VRFQLIVSPLAVVDPVLAEQLVWPALIVHDAYVTRLPVVPDPALCSSNVYELPELGVVATLTVNPVMVIGTPNASPVFPAVVPVASLLPNPLMPSM
jgi:hypothetical protein